MIVFSFERKTKCRHFCCCCCLATNYESASLSPNCVWCLAPQKTKKKQNDCKRNQHGIWVVITAQRLVICFLRFCSLWLLLLFRHFCHFLWRFYSPILLADFLSLHGKWCHDLLFGSLQLWSIAFPTYQMERIFQFKRPIWKHHTNMEANFYSLQKEGNKKMCSNK